MGEHILIAFYLDFSLENNAYFSEGSDRYHPVAPLYVYRSPGGKETVKVAWPSLDWPGLVLVADGVDLPCPLPRN